MKPLRIFCKLPWWWRLYIWALMSSEYLGVIEVDPDVAAEFIMRHTKFNAE